VSYRTIIIALIMFALSNASKVSKNLIFIQSTPHGISRSVIRSNQLAFFSVDVTFNFLMIPHDELSPIAKSDCVPYHNFDSGPWPKNASAPRCRP